MPQQVELLDGGTGEELFRLGVPDDRKTWSAYALTHDEFHGTVVDVHRSYLLAGATYITTNNYMVTPAGHFSPEDNPTYVKVAGQLARDAINSSTWNSPRKVCGSLPPLSESYRHDLVLPATDAIPLYTVIGESLSPYVDLFLAETMSSIAEARNALTGVQHLGKPMLVSFTLRGDGVLRSGETVADALAMLQSMAHPVVVGVLFNCCEPEAVTIALRSLISSSFEFRIGAYANALTPVPDGWVMEGASPQSFRTDLSPTEYLEHVQEWIRLGASLVGGCCAVGPRHIQAFHDAVIVGAVPAVHDGTSAIRHG
ncbi:hypothetical protein DYB26_006386 [Aphanomyces astaci]|uniref:Hcy-binding domain-containing protein n=2 Tax=Aphanomyces astaci TaxID=112090 RepID=A0A397FCH6_APHAT|nr:hypothetical protein DYB26_006386 [Aphanomyces astaci]RHZ26587.1 hypothetical protein DYB31_009707 [Aphanomyces astaci]